MTSQLAIALLSAVNYHNNQGPNAVPLDTDKDIRVGPVVLRNNQHPHPVKNR